MAACMYVYLFVGAWLRVFVSMCAYGCVPVCWLYMCLILDLDYEGLYYVISIVMKAFVTSFHYLISIDYYVMTKSYY